MSTREKIGDNIKRICRLAKQLGLSAYAVSVFWFVGFMDTNESDAMANQVDVDKIIFRNVFIDFISNFYKDAKRFRPKMETGLPVYIFAWNFTFDVSWSAGQTADKKSNIKILTPPQSCKSTQKPLVVSGFFSGRSKNL